MMGSDLTKVFVFTLVIKCLLVRAEEVTIILNYDPMTREYTKIDNHTVNVGDTLNILVQPAESDNSLCRFQPQNTDDNQRAEPEPNGGTQNLSPPDKNRPGWTYSWYGFNTAKDCGITIHSVAVADNGGWLVDYGSKTFQFYILAKSAPKNVEIDIVTTGPNNVYEFESNGSVVDPFPLKCIARGSVPEPIFYWELSNGGSLNTTFTSMNASASNTLGAKDYTSLFKYYPMPSHDGQEMRCVVSHEQYTGDDYAREANIAAFNISVQSIPDPIDWQVTYDGKVKVGKEVKLGVRFTSNPKPNNVTWILPGLANGLEVGNFSNENTLMSRNSEGVVTNGKYTAQITNEGNVYTAKLTISKLEKSEKESTYTLLVSNDLTDDWNMNATRYEFQLELYQGLSDGEIAGIVIGSIAGVALLGAAGFFGYKEFKKRQRKKKAKKVRQAQRKRQQEEETEPEVEEGVENHGSSIEDVDLGSVHSSDS